MIRSELNWEADEMSTVPNPGVGPEKGGCDLRIGCSVVSESTNPFEAEGCSIQGSIRHRPHSNRVVWTVRPRAFLIVRID